MSSVICYQTLIVLISRTNVKSRRKLLIKLLPSNLSNIHIAMTVLNISIISVRVAPSLHLLLLLWTFDVIWYNFYLSLRHPSQPGRRKHSPDMKTHFNKTKMRRGPDEDWLIQMRWNIKHWHYNLCNGIIQPLSDTSQSTVGSGWNFKL